MEAPAEDPVGGGAEGDWEREEPVDDPGSPRRWEAQSGGARLPLHYGRGKIGSAEEDVGSGASGWELRELRERGGERGGRSGGAGCRENWVPGRSCHCSYPRPLLLNPQTTIRGRIALSLFPSFISHSHLDSFPL